MFLKDLLMESRDVWAELKKMPGGDKDPFNEPVGPTPECLSSVQVVEYVKKNSREQKVVEHIGKCSECRGRIKRFRIATE
jgi:hypothetical protein